MHTTLPDRGSSVPVVFNQQYFFKWLLFQQNRTSLKLLLFMLILINFQSFAQQKTINQTKARERININRGWLFMRYTGKADELIYDERPSVFNRKDDIIA
jgi:beta-galactosidase